MVEGILYADHYGEMLTRLRADHRGPTHAYEVGEAQLRDRYRELDPLPGGVETVMGADSTLAETVVRIMLDTGLAGLPALGLQSPVPVTRSYVPGRA